MKIRGLCCTVLALAGSPLTLADPLGFEFSTSVSSGLIDRGETLATLNNETSFTLAQPLQFGEVYGSLYRISPIGGEANAFDEEVDYSIGFTFENGGISYDTSANYLTFPGSDEEASLELAVEIGFEQKLSPSLAAFYDVDAEVCGVEAAIGPAIEVGDWTLTGIVRGGFVSSDDEDYSYGGVEGVAAAGCQIISPLRGLRALRLQMRTVSFQMFEMAPSLTPKGVAHWSACDLSFQANQQFVAHVGMRFRLGSWLQRLHKAAIGMPA